MRKTLCTMAGAAIVMAATSGLALAQYTTTTTAPAPAAPPAANAPSNAVSGAATGAARGGAAGAATGAAAGTANAAAGAPTAAMSAHPGYGSSMPPASGTGGCPTGEMNYKGSCYPNQPSAFTK